MKIYMAGSLFSAAERSFNRRLRDSLEQYGYEVWLPQEHEPRKRGAREIFLTDVRGLDRSDVVVANMDGPDPDSGTCWECGYAYKKKPIIVYRTDFRSSGDTKTTPYNLMLTESADVRLDLPFKDEKQTARAIHEALVKLKRSGSAKGPNKAFLGRPNSIDCLKNVPATDKRYRRHHQRYFREFPEVRDLMSRVA
jgi:nucleoside 2-deoxyribosyltransferase